MPLIVHDDFPLIIDTSNTIGDARLYGPSTKALLNSGHHSKLAALFVIWYIDQNVIPKDGIMLPPEVEEAYQLLIVLSTC